MGEINMEQVTKKEAIKFLNSKFAESMHLCDNVETKNEDMAELITMARESLASIDDSIYLYKNADGNDGFILESAIKKYIPRIKTLMNMMDNVVESNNKFIEDYQKIGAESKEEATNE
jgi:hypothetical protein